MNPTQTAFYDAETRTLWIARRFFEPRTRVSRDEVKHWMRVVREGGATEDGRPIEAVHYLFIDEATAAYNHATLSFAGLGVYYQDGGNRVPYVPADGGPRFDVRSDFGVEAPGEEDEG